MVPAEWLADPLALIAQTPHLDWLLLTKRPELWRERIHAACWPASSPGGGSLAAAWKGGSPPPNVWIGTSVEDQQRAEERVPHLLKIPARVRFLSCEPLLGELDLGFLIDGEPWLVDWVICGGESGPGARPMHPAWARSLRDQCQEAGVAFHFKQWGAWAPSQYFGWACSRVGKKKAGRELDGRTWDEVPSPNT